MDNERGLYGVQSGDIALKKVFSFNADIRYERRIGEWDKDSAGRQVIEDLDGKPVIKNKHYVAAIYDDWLIISVLNQQVVIGLPAFNKHIQSR